MKKQRNKYLDKLGLKLKEYGTNWYDGKDKKEWKKQRKDYGFDSRETWNLNHNFVEWLYSHLKMYKKEASKIIDLTAHKINWDEKEITQIEAIDILLKECKFFLINVNGTDLEKEKKAYERMQKATKLWAELFPYMWW